MDYAGYPFDEVPAWSAALSLSFDRTVGELCLEYVAGNLTVEQFGQAVLDARTVHNLEHLDKWLEEVN